MRGQIRNVGTRRRGLRIPPGRPRPTARQRRQAGAKASGRDWAQWVTSIVALAALLFTGLSMQETRRQNAISEQGQITDRFGKAVEQLGSNTRDVRMGGLYALERIMHGSPADRQTITEVLAAYLRERVPRAS